MSTVLLMTDAWQPTVLRIVPFSSNNARSLDRKSSGKGANGSRGFPVLAVTRSAGQKSSSASSGSRSGGRSAASDQNSDGYSIISNASRNTSAIERNQTPRTDTSSAKQRKFAKKKVPEMHSEMKEAIKFSVQDINDQISSTSSLNSSENKDENKEKHCRVDNTRTRLPKPSLSSSPELRTYYSPVNGVRRSVPLTPGELELQRIRDSYYVEQVQKRKKYKLNVNQLPRSTTPINDHDPDKLNMKQVIAFLQTKTIKDNHKKVVPEKKQSDTGARNVNVRYARKYSDVPSVSTSPSPKKIFAKDTVQGLSRSNSEVKTVDRTDNTRMFPGCISVMSTKSSPNFSCSSQATPKPSKAPSTRSSRSFRSKDKKSDRQKPVKEFKLYRFLAIAPDGQTQGSASTVSDAIPTIEKSIVTEELRSTDQPRRLFSYRSKDRESGTARVLHRHVINRAALTPPKVETKENTASVDDPRAIRLPLMADAPSDSADADSDSGSTTSATHNSTKHNFVKEERLNGQKKGKPTAFSDLNINLITNTPESSQMQTDSPDHTARSDIPSRTHKVPGFPRVNIPAAKQIRVNVPNDSKKPYSHEIVRLTLRQDKNATRVTSYMSDIESSATKCGDSPDTSRTVCTPRSAILDSTELLETCRQSVSSLSYNSLTRLKQT